MEFNERIFFNPGDIVRIKQNIAAPNMVVKHINKAHRKDIDESESTSAKLLGITCFWFSQNDVYQCQLFSTKDLKHVK